MTKSNSITVETNIKATMDKVWQCWTQPEHIKKWNNASEDWYTPSAENDLEKGGKFTYRMEAKDGSFGFDFSGTYTTVEPKEHLAYSLDDNRKVTVDFKLQDDQVKVTETFEPENENPIDMQKRGWQAILDYFKRYAENLK